MKTDYKNTLTEFAKDARKNSYSPYSGHAVGAALLCKSGKIYSGCNVENAAYGPTCCAERVALFSAIADGEREFSAIAVVGNNPLCMPCGVCRQVFSEFCDGNFEILVEDKDGKIVSFTQNEILPYSFKLEKQTNGEENE